MTILFLIVIIVALVGAFFGMRQNLNVVKFDLEEAEADLAEAESDNTDLLNINDTLTSALHLERFDNATLRYAIGDLRVALGKRELSYALLRQASINLARSSDQYINDLETKLDAAEAELDYTDTLLRAAVTTIDTLLDGIETESAVTNATIEHLLDTMVPVDMLATLTNAVAAYDDAADKFIDKVESGRARSTETYNDLKAARGWNAGMTGVEVSADADLTGVSDRVN